MAQDSTITEEMVLVPKELWKRVLYSLDGASLCDHNEILPLLAEIQEKELD